MDNCTVVTTLPQCNFCSKVARYDFKTKKGPWAFGCENHWRTERLFAGLGLGQGQLLISKVEVMRMAQKLASKELSRAVQEIRERISKIPCETMGG